MVVMLLGVLVKNPKMQLNVEASSHGAYFNKHINSVSKLDNVDVIDDVDEDLILNEPDNIETTSQSLEGFEEDVSRRDEFTKVYLNKETGEERVIVHLNPVHEFVGDTWKDIDLNLKSVKSSSDNNQYINKTSKRSLSVDNEQVIADDFLKFQFEESLEKNAILEQVLPTQYGYIYKTSINQEGLSLPFEVKEGYSLKQSESNLQVNVYDDTSNLVAVISPRSINDGT